MRVAYHSLAVDCGRLMMMMMCPPVGKLMGWWWMYHILRKNTSAISVDMYDVHDMSSSVVAYPFKSYHRVPTSYCVRPTYDCAFNWPLPKRFNDDTNRAFSLCYSCRRCIIRNFIQMLIFNLGFLFKWQTVFGRKLLNQTSLLKINAFNFFFWNTFIPKSTNLWMWQIISLFPKCSPIIIMRTTTRTKCG
jgi:hypothetical protein